MSKKTSMRGGVESPCIDICVIHPPTRLCTGCLRSIDEIAAWSAMSPAARREVMATLPARQSLISQRRGGRAGRLAKGE